jgi:hypothetical protein
VAAPRLLPALILAALALPGCVHRVLLLRTDPPGARVSVNGVAMGVAPLEMPFLHYGRVRVEAEPLDRDEDGSPDTRRAVTEVDLSTPWYQWPVIDFFADNLWPWTVTDRHEAVIVLPPGPDPDEREGQEELRRLEGELRARARDARREAEGSAAGGKK